MAALVVSATTGNGNSTAVTVSYPSLASTDYVELAIVWLNTTSPAFTPPSGFTAITGSQTGTPVNDTGWATWRGWRMGSGGGTSASLSAGIRFAWVVFSAGGLYASPQPETQNVSATSGTGTQTTTSETGVTVTTGAPNDLLTHVFGARIAANGVTATWVQATGTQLIAQACSSASSVFNVGLAVMWENATTVGTTTTRTATINTSTAGTAYTPGASLVANRAPTLIGTPKWLAQTAMTRSAVF